MGKSRVPIVIDHTDKSQSRLPDSYVMVPPCELAKHDVYVPYCNGEQLRPKQDKIEVALLREQVWIQSVK